jgi:hypothetical protein
MFRGATAQERLMTIFGWDMSHFDAPDLGTAVAEGISFVTHKAGGDAVDSELPAWWAGVRTLDPQKVLLGAYWVLYPGNPAGRADAFLARLDAACPGWRDRPFLLQADCEKWNGDPRTVPSKAEIKTFCDRLVARMPRLRPVVYAPKWVYGNDLTGLPYPLWASSYVTAAGGFRKLYPGDSSSRWQAYSGQTPAILQYTSSATIGGQATSDANAYRGTLDQLVALVAPGWEDNAMATLTDAEKAQLLTDARRTHVMVRNLENLIYALAGGQASRPGYKDDETGVTFASTPISPNVVLAELAGRVAVTPADLTGALAGLPTAQETAEAVIAGLAGHSAEDIAAALKAALGDRAPEVGRLLATSVPVS